MLKLLFSNIGRLRVVGFLEGVSFIILVFIGVPMKYIFHNEALVKSAGPIHGILFVLFILLTIIASIEQKWSFKQITWKVLLSSLIPFGTFYVDKKILSKIGK